MEQLTGATLILFQIALSLFILAELVRLFRKHILPKSKMCYGKFMTTRYGSGDKIVYQYREYELAAVDLDNGLFGYKPNKNNDNIEWIGFENCYYIGNEK